MAAELRRADVQKGLLAAAMGGLLFTFDLPLLRLAGLDQWTMVFGRGLFLFLTISIGWFLLPGQPRLRQAFIAGPAGIGAVVTNTLAPITYIAAISHTTAADVVFIMALIPLLSAILSRFFIGEHVHALTWLATLFALLGVGIIVGDSLGRGHVLGDVMAIASALCTALAITLIRATGKQMVTSFATGSLVSALVALLGFGASPLGLLHVAGFGLPAWFWLGFNGLVFIPLALILVTESPRLIPSTDVSMFFLLETMLTPIWIWLLTGELPRQQALIGGAVILLTLLVHSLWRLRSTMAPPAAARNKVYNALGHARQTRATGE
jgi:drug/metabolite transporter (DMT)-like permease